MYYVLQCFSSLLKDSAGIDKCPEIEGIDSWMTGKIINKEIPQPIELSLDPQSPGELLEMYQLEMTIMSDRLVSALIEFGINNLQIYDALIYNPLDGSIYDNYKVVNIIGVVSCADMEESIYQPSEGALLIDVDFESLVIDEKAVHGLYMFRLAECISAILIHEKVKDFLLTKGFDNLTFQNPSEFIG